MKRKVECEKVFNRFHNKIKGLNHTRLRSETLFREGTICERDYFVISNAILLESVTYFERFIEDVFVGLAIKDLTHPSGDFLNIVEILPKKNFSDVIRGDKLYIDWLPYERTIDRSKTYFKNGYPFTGLSVDDKGELASVMSLRNAIAHRSEYAINKLRTRLSNNGITVYRKDNVPARYLTRFQSRDTTYLYFHMMKLGVIGKKIVKA